MPLWKFQTVGRERLDFLYANTGAGNTIILRPGVAFCFRLSGTFDLNFRAVDSTELPGDGNVPYVHGSLVIPLHAAGRTPPSMPG